MLDATKKLYGDLKKGFHPKNALFDPFLHFCQPPKMRLKLAFFTHFLTFPSIFRHKTVIQPYIFYFRKLLVLGNPLNTYSSGVGAHKKFFRSFENNFFYSKSPLFLHFFQILKFVKKDQIFGFLYFYTFFSFSFHFFFF